MRATLRLAEKVPNPVSLTLSPLLRAAVMPPVKASMAAVLELTALELIGPQIAITRQVLVKWPPVSSEHFQLDYGSIP